MSSVLNVTTIKAFTSVAQACSYLQAFSLRIWGTGCSVFPGPRNSQAPKYSQSQSHTLLTSVH